MKLVQTSSQNVSKLTPEEKKRRVEGDKSPTLPQSQQMLTLLPTGSTSLSMPVGVMTSHPVLSVSGTSNPQPIILAPSTGGTQTIIQNGTLNGLPMFQIVNNQNLAVSQPAQFVAIAQSPGRSLLTNTFQKSPPLLPQKGVPVLLTPVQLPTSVKTVAAGSQQQMMTTPTKLATSIAAPVLGSQQVLVSSSLHSTVQQQHSVLKQTLNTKHVIQPANGQVLESGKPTSREVTSVPNGLYPVTPPRTPEEQRSESGSQDNTEEIEVPYIANSISYALCILAACLVLQTGLSGMVEIETGVPLVSIPQWSLLL